MCGRYYIDDETAREIEKLVHNLDRRLQSSCKKDIYPAQNALVLRGDNHDEIFAEQMIWGIKAKKNLALRERIQIVCLWQDVLTYLTVRIDL